MEQLPFSRAPERIWRMWILFLWEWSGSGALLGSSSLIILVIALLVHCGISSFDFENLHFFRKLLDFEIQDLNMAWKLRIQAYANLFKFPSICIVTYFTCSKYVLLFLFFSSFNFSDMDYFAYFFSHIKCLNLLTNP